MSRGGGPAERNEILRAVAIDVPLLFVLKLAVGLYALSIGFTHVSDDDYARVVIAQQFAHHPALDPSGTSWLPFPFWLTGAAMLAFGPSLEVARVVACALGTVTVAAPYAAMRAAGCARATSLAAVGVALALPWSAWLGVATVPEAMTACLVAAGAIAVTSPRARLPGAIALLAASLSRYEAWPACAVFAVACFLAARRATSPGERAVRSGAWAAASIALAGPLAWMAWNAHAHGSALHFVARVTAYRQSIGAAAIPLGEKLTAFPRALVVTSPAVLALALLGACALPLDEALRRRWLPPLAAAGAILAFLVYGDVRDGAPTHHPERALLPVIWLLVAFAADALRTLARRAAWGRPQREMWVFGLSLAGGLAWLALLPEELRDAPGRGPNERRTAQIARGRRLPAGDYQITPCAYEHFAFMAAAAAPERFTVLPATHAPITGNCPRVEELSAERVR